LPTSQRKNVIPTESQPSGIPVQRTSFTGQASKNSPDLTNVLPDADRLKELIDALRKGQSALDITQARWPALRNTLQRLTTVLKATRSQLDQAIDHRQDYEAALEQTVQLADTFSIMLPLVTDQLDGRLDEEERTLMDLGRNLDDVGQALPAYATTTSRLLATGRLLAWLLAAIVGLHGLYVTLSAAQVRRIFATASCPRAQ
jgi:hypothetical protein